MDRKRQGQQESVQDKDDDKKDEKQHAGPEPLKFDLANRKDRIMRSTVNSSPRDAVPIAAAMAGMVAPRISKTEPRPVAPYTPAENDHQNH
ncbi:MAG: hypothetical protein ACLRS8_02465 [Parabacteroides merdae]